MTLNNFRQYLRQRVAVLLLMVWLPWAAADIQPAFSNFQKPVHLVELGDGNYQIGFDGPMVIVGQRLVVRIGAEFDTGSLIGIRGLQPSVQDLYRSQFLHYIALDLTEQANWQQVMDQVAAVPGVELVQPDLLHLGDRRAALKNTPPPEVKPLPASVLQQFERFQPASGGRGVRVALIDDGYDWRHPQLATVQPAFQYDVSNRQLDARPKNSADRHGTAIASLLFAAPWQLGNQNMAGLIPQASLIAIRQPDTWTSNTLLAFQLATMAGADIINCSWNSGLLVQPVADVVRDLAIYGRHGIGMPVIVAAGNEGHLITPDSSEAAISEALVVGAVDSNGQRAGFSNYGPSVDLAAYGMGVTTAAPGQKYQVLNGTSLSAPLVTAATAMLLSRQPHMDLDDLHKALVAAFPPSAVNESPVVPAEGEEAVHD